MNKEIPLLELARIGIMALVDEATKYQEDRSPTALADMASPAVLSLRDRVIKGVSVGEEKETEH